MLAPMVHSGARKCILLLSVIAVNLNIKIVPTRLFALKYSVSLVWSPEIINKAILHSTRSVDPSTGVISYFGSNNNSQKAIFTTHPIEKPLLCTQEKTLALVQKIVATNAIDALTIHCRTRNQREKDGATIERLREIVDYVKRTLRREDIAVIANGNCVDVADALGRVEGITGADSVMIARGAEANPSCFLIDPPPLRDYPW